MNGVVKACSSRLLLVIKSAFLSLGIRSIGQKCVIKVLSQMYGSKSLEFYNL